MRSKLTSLFHFALALTLISPTFAQQAADTVQPEAQVTSPDLSDGRLVIGTKWMLATANPHASEAGANILRDGGNAIDAMVAVQTTLSLTEPQSSGLGGGGFLVYWDNKKKRLLTFDGRETAPSAITPKLFLDENGKPLKFFDAVVSGLSIGVPGMPRLLHEAHKEYGSKPWPTLLDHAIDLAQEGFEISPRLSGLLERRARTLKRFETTQNYFFGKDGMTKQAGNLLKNPDYAKTLQALQKGGADAFYKGPLAAEIVNAVQNANGRAGMLSLEDMASYKIRKRKPICAPYREFEVCGMGPPSSGAIAISQILGTLEPFDLATMGPDNPESWQLIGDATRLAFADRGRYVADDDFLPVPTNGLIARGYLLQRSSQLAAGKRLKVAKPGKPKFDHALNYADDQALELPSTTHFVIRDAEGNVVSMTSSIESAFGSNLMVGGFLLNNQLTDFSFVTHVNGRPVANAAAPGKKPRSSMAPTLILQAGEPYVAIGSPGGSRIIPYVAKSIIAMIDWDMNIQQAIDLPHVTNRFGTFALEANTKAVELKAPLEAMGYQTVVISLNSGLHGLVVHEDRLEGGADKRREGVVIAE